LYELPYEKRVAAVRRGTVPPNDTQRERDVRLPCVPTRTANATIGAPRRWKMCGKTRALRAMRAHGQLILTIAPPIQPARRTMP
jgi:hypothetical protein